MSFLHKVLQIDVRETYVPQSLNEKCTAAIATGAASQFIFNILIFLIFISKSLSVVILVSLGQGSYNIRTTVSH